MPKNILDGIRVLDLTMFQLGPIQAVMLAAMGAEVIKIEAPVGDPGRSLFSKMPGTEGKVPYYPHMTSYFETCNQNKKGMVLDLKLPRAKEILYELVAKSDVFINNMRLGVAERLGADYETLKKYNPKLIYSAGNSFGSKGPEAAKPGFDFTGAARTGVFFRVPNKEVEPAHCLAGSHDQVPAMMGALGIVAALLARERYGIGQKVEISHLSGLIWLMQRPMQCMFYDKANGAPPPRHRSEGGNPIHNHFKCADGQWIAFHHNDPNRYWPPLAQALGIPESVWKDDPRFNTTAARATNNKECIVMLDEIFAKKTRDEWIKAFEGKDIVWEKVQNWEDLPTDPQVIANEVITDYVHPITGETYKYVMQPFEFSETPARERGRAPILGEHTEEVLVDILGYKKEDVPKLLDEIGRPVGTLAAAK